VIPSRLPSDRSVAFRARAFLLLAAGLALFPATDCADASETRWWATASSAAYEDAGSDGLVIDPDGVVTLGPAASVTLLDSIEVVWSAAVLANGRIALGGNGGRILLASRGRAAAPWVTLPVGQVLSLLADGDDLIAGTGPEGFVYRIRPNGDTTRIAVTGERYVWALAAAGRSGWYAATGIRGRVLHVGRDGRTRVVFDNDAGNVVALIEDGRGGAYAGDDTRGRIVHLRADGSARTLFDAEEDEVRALALGADGALYAAALTSSAVQNADGAEDAKPRPARRPTSRETSRVYRIVADSASVVWWSTSRTAIFALAPAREGVLAATGNRAGLFLLDGPGRASQWLAPLQGQITAVTRSSDGVFYAATSNPAALWELRPGERRSGELRSPVFDAKRLAQFGTIRWLGEAGGARVELETRSGNAAIPDTTWSLWTAPRGAGDGRGVASPPARYLQWRLRLAGGQPRIETVEVAWRENNLPPMVEALRVAPQVDGFREGRLSTRTEPVTQELPGGRKVEFSLKRKSDESDLKSLPLWVQGLRTVQWNAEDPNEDPLRYRLDARRDGDSDWTPVARDLEDSVFVWDTNGVPDGRYRLRVTASDIEGNAVGEERESWAIGSLVVIDNTPPVLTSLDVTGGRGRVTVRGAAADAGTIARIEVSIGDGAWRTITPAGGMADDERPAFDATLDGLAAGVHSVTVRVVDRAGNFAVRAARATVTP
jgi:hypothetical protein